MHRIEIDDLSRSEVLALIEEHLRNMHEMSPPENVFAFDVDKLKAPGVSFWTAWSGDRLDGCAALKELSADTGEIKSMRTPAKLRRTGAGRALLNHLIQVARQRGYRRLYLETGSHPGFLPALTLYRSVGFSECGPFGPYTRNDFSVFMSLRLESDVVHAGVAEGGPPSAARSDLNGKTKELDDE
jgi:putative acetyltransferase